MSRVSQLPRVDDSWPRIERRLRGRNLAFFLDFDGTLAPIVADPGAARLPDATRTVLEELRDRWPVVIVSGRDADDVRARVGAADLVIAGSHGFDVVWPDGRRTERGGEFAERLRAAARDLRDELAGVPGTEVEAKRFAVAVHHRRTPGDRLEEVERAVARVAAREPTLRRSGGKQVLELRPALDWDKGTTVAWLLTELGLDGADTVPIYLGDDLTDEDAFATLAARDRGLGLLVRGEDDARPTAAHYVIDDVAGTPDVLRRLGRLGDPQR